MMINDLLYAVSNGNLAHDRQDGHLMCPVTAARRRQA
jgi:hypothetical protein